MASLIHDTSPILRHSLQQSHNKGSPYYDFYGFRDTILSRLVTIIKSLVHHAVHCIILVLSLVLGGSLPRRAYFELLRAAEAKNAATINQLNLIFRHILSEAHIYVNERYV